MNLQNVKKYRYHRQVHLTPIVLVRERHPGEKGSRRDETRDGDEDDDDDKQDRQTDTNYIYSETKQITLRRPIHFVAIRYPSRWSPVLFLAWLGKPVFPDRPRPIDFLASNSGLPRAFRPGARLMVIANGVLDDGELVMRVYRIQISPWN